MREGAREIETEIEGGRECVGVAEEGKVKRERAEGEKEGTRRSEHEKMRERKRERERERERSPGRI